MENNCLATGEDGQVRPHGTERSEEGHSEGEGQRTLALLRERHLRYHGPRSVRSFTGNRRDLPARESLAARRRPYKYERRASLGKQRDLNGKTVTGLSRWYPAAFGEVPTSAKRHRAVRNYYFVVYLSYIYMWSSQETERRDPATTRNRAIANDCYVNHLECGDELCSDQSTRESKESSRCDRERLSSLCEETSILNGILADLCFFFLLIFFAFSVFSLWSDRSSARTRRRGIHTRC